MEITGISNRDMESQNAHAQGIIQILRQINTPELENNLQMWEDLLTSSVDAFPREQTWRERDEILPVQPLPKPVQEEGEAGSAHSKEAQRGFWVWNLWKEVSRAEQSEGAHAGLGK